VTPLAQLPVLVSPRFGTDTDGHEGDMSLLTILLIVVIVLLLFGGLGYSRRGR
jgi:hypothetical protein